MTATMFGSAGVTRRTLGKGIIAASTFLSVGRGLAAEPSGKDGFVYQQYDQAGLDRAYDQRVWAPNAGEVIKRYSTDSAAVRERLAFTTVQYGPSTDETMDVFRPAAAPGQTAPIHLHLHGGAWQSLTRSDVSFLAPTFVDSGAIYVALNFSTMPAATLPEMMAQCRRAIAWLHAHAGEIGGDAERIHVSGHSSGAHMAGVLLATDWAAQGLPPTVLKSGVLLSGMYDLEPVMLSSRSKYVKLLAQEVDELSAIHHLDRIHAPVVASYGDKESPEFKRQSATFVSGATGKGMTAALIPAGPLTHFEMPYVLLDRSALLTRLTLSLMGLPPAS